MAQILPLDPTKARAAGGANTPPRDPFDVVVFLDHFLQSDTYPDGLIAQFEDARATAPCAITPASFYPKTHMVMQYGQDRLAFTLGTP